MWKTICAASTASAVFYADDAFAGLHLMEDLSSPNGAREKRIAEGKVVKENRPRTRAWWRRCVAESPNQSPRICIACPSSEIPQPPFWGVRG